MAKKTDRIRPRLPRGFADREPSAIRAVDAMVRKVVAVYERYGFEPVETPLVEFTEALGKFLPDEDRPGQGVFSFQDEDEAWLSLRYDLTAPLARHFAENFDRLPKPYRSYRTGWVLRNEKPGPGRFRQFMQLDADTVGSASPAADAEMAMMLADVLDELGLEGKYVVKISSRAVLDGAMQLIGAESDKQKLGIMRSLDKLDRLGEGGVVDLLGNKGRKDDSGDVTPGVGLSENQINRLFGIIGWGEEGSGSRSSFNNQMTASNLQDELESVPTAAQAARDLWAMSEMFERAGYVGKITVDPSVVRGLEYYTGPVFEAELTFPVTNEKGQEVVFGSVAGGGRYDGLVSRFRAEPVPATGISIGVSRLAEALRLTGNLATDPAPGPVVVCVMDRDRIADYQQIVAELRNAGIAAEMFLGNPKNLGKQLSYADARNAPAVLIEGADERAAGEVQIKDLIAGKRASAEIEGREQWVAERPGQFAVKRENLVAEITKLLARQAKEG